METWDSEEQLLMLKKCNELIGKFRKVVCFYSNPRLPVGSGLQSLNALTREMRNVIHSLSAVHYHLEPATTKTNVEEALQRYKPDLVAFSAHTFNNQMVLEHENGKPEFVNADTFTEMIVKSTVDNPPTCILLLACDTLVIAEALSVALPNTCIMFWISVKVEDIAAQFFTRSFFEFISTVLEKKRLFLSDYIDCWQYSVDKFSEHFEIQDPEEFLKYKIMPPDIVRGIPAYMINGVLKKATITSPSTPSKNTKNIDGESEVDPPALVRNGTSSSVAYRTDKYENRRKKLTF